MNVGVRAKYNVLAVVVLISGLAFTAISHVRTRNESGKSSLMQHSGNLLKDMKFTLEYHYNLPHIKELLKFNSKVPAKEIDDYLSLYQEGGKLETSRYETPGKNDEERPGSERDPGRSLSLRPSDNLGGSRASESGSKGEKPNR